VTGVQTCALPICVLRKQFPNSQILGDIQEVSGEQLISAGFTPQHGVIVGGFPCQDLSVAGKRAGLAGARSGLFWEICRLLDETRRVFIVGCLGDDGRAPSEVLALIEGMRRYSAEINQKRKKTPSATPLSTGEHGRTIANALPAELYHHATVVNQDVSSGHLVVHQK